MKNGETRGMPGYGCQESTLSRRFRDGLCQKLPEGKAMEMETKVCAFPTLSMECTLEILESTNKFIDSR